MRVALVNWFHAGDIILCRAIIRRVRPFLIDAVALELRCHQKYAYLWEDLGLPIVCDTNIPADVHAIDLWFGHGGDLLGVTGLTYATHIISYNRQAKSIGIPEIPSLNEAPDIDFSAMTTDDPPGILVENGPVLSGQPTLELNPVLGQIASAFPQHRFYCASPPPSGHANLIDVSGKNLKQISALSNRCIAMLARLSGVFVASLTSQNRGRLPRLVLGRPIGCPIWDETDVSYHGTLDDLVERLRSVVG